MMRLEIECCVREAHLSKRSDWLCIPGESSWSVVVSGEVKSKPLCAHVIYLVTPTYLDGEYVAKFEICFINMQRPGMPCPSRVQVGYPRLMEAA